VHPNMQHKKRAEITLYGRIVIEAFPIADWLELYPERLPTNGAEWKVLSP